MKTLATIMLSLLAVTSARADAPTSPAALGLAFCAAKDSPDTLITTLVTPALAEAIRIAVERNDTIAKAEPDEKPPLGDGIPFQAYPDVSPQCEVGAISGEGPGAIVEIRHVFPDAPSAGWTDRLVVGVGAGGALAIDDALYGPEGDDGLRKLLASVGE
ncbi:MAG: hypothetical protein Q8Q62_15905 [Mesorhizobium sp.]|nr:hypothetical protein [Mesorhizobium sp.]